jgi:hypothetical protein
LLDVKEKCKCTHYLYIAVAKAENTKQRLFQEREEDKKKVQEFQKKR